MSRDRCHPSIASGDAVVRVHAPAKVNLVLRVLAREESGFHQLETVFAALEFGDTLTLAHARSGISVDTGGVELGPVEGNLAYRAAKGFLERCGIADGLTIQLQKRIPVKGGLGGGSSNAGATLRGLQALFPGFLSGEELMDLAGSLGSDVPFFVSPSPLALGLGRGDRILPLTPLPSLPVVLAIPPVGVGTGAAYGMLARAREGRPGLKLDRLLSAESFYSWDAVAALARNDFEEVILPGIPRLAKLRQGLQATAPLFSLLSGSGSTLFAVYAEEGQAASGLAILEGAFPDTRFVLTRTLFQMSEPSSELGG
jgi:4-diphosphocytidyl-2-C-methyl-D-erythritol kinase